MAGAPWPFAEPPDTAAITLRRIIQEHRPILYVTHDAEDGMFQFLDGQPVTPADGVVVGLGEMLELDASLCEVADLPPGWTASRPDPASPWERTQHA